MNGPADAIPGDELDESDAFAERLEQARPGLASWLARRGVPADRVDDAVQEAIVRAWRSRGSIDPGRPLGPWLVTIAERAFLDEERSRRRGARREAASGTESDLGADRAIAADPARRAEVRETIERLERELARLPARLGEVFRRFHREERPIAEIAVELGLPVGTVKSDLHRARRALTEALLGESPVGRRKVDAKTECHGR